MVKKVAFTQLSARICSTWLLLRGSGPSSKVSTISWSASGSVSGYCIEPMRGCSRGSTTIVREVPSASGWPGQSAAEAAQVATQTRIPSQTAVQDPIRMSVKKLPTINYHPHSPDRDDYMPCHERGINCRFPVHASDQGRGQCQRPVQPAPDAPLDSDSHVDSAGMPAAWRRYGPSG